MFTTNIQSTIGLRISENASPHDTEESYTRRLKLKDEELREPCRRRYDEDVRLSGRMRKEDAINEKLIPKAELYSNHAKDNETNQFEIPHK